MRIVILEDNVERQVAMREVIQDIFPRMSIEFFAVARKMIERLESTGIYDVALISLDNDLDMVPAEHGRYVDAGDGIEVAEWLITRPPVVPVLVHTTNTPAGDQIDKLLHAHGWFHDRVVPYDGEAWISEVWRSSVRRLIVTHTPEATVSSAGVTVLKHGLQTGLPLEAILKDILEVLSVHSRGGEDVSDLSIELAYLCENKILKAIVSVGNLVISEFMGAAPCEILHDCADLFGIGPIEADKATIEPSLRSLLLEKGFREIQFDVIQPMPGHHAVLLTGNRSNRLQLNASSVQANLRAAKSLLELLLLTANPGPQNETAGRQWLEQRPERHPGRSADPGNSLVHGSLRQPNLVAMTQFGIWWRNHRERPHEPAADGGTQPRAA